MSADLRLFLASLDDTRKEWRMFMLDTNADDSVEIVCSRPLTRRALQIRMIECSDSRRPLAVNEAYLTRFRQLPPDTRPNAEHFGMHPVLGQCAMFLELLARAWEKRLIEEKKQPAKENSP